MREYENVSRAIVPRRAAEAAAQAAVTPDMHTRETIMDYMTAVDFKGGASQQENAVAMELVINMIVHSLLEKQKKEKGREKEEGKQEDE